MDKVELRACFKIQAGFLVLVVVLVLVLEDGPNFEDDDEDEDDYDSSTAFLKHALSSTLSIFRWVQMRFLVMKNLQGLDRICPRVPGTTGGCCLIMIRI